MFIPSMLTETMNYSSTQASLVLTYTGITNTISRVIFGIILDHPAINPALFVSLAFTLSGLILIMVPFGGTYTYFVIIGCIFGAVTAPHNIGPAIVLGIFLPLEKVESAFGILGFVVGSGDFIGLTISGYIYDITHDFGAIFVASGILFVCSGLSCYMANHFNEPRKKTCQMS